MLKTLLQTKKHLYSLIPILQKQKFPGELGLLRMKDLLGRLNNPQNNFPSIHIAGTSGKDSIAYLISRITSEGNYTSPYGSCNLLDYKVGLHISPHLQTMRERLQINNKLISKKEFISLINRIKPVVEKMKSGQYGKPSYFEVLLAVTFLYFAQKKVDLAVIETGMGGRFDGTNVLKPVIAVLTTIGLDHTRVLGKTKTLILKEKMQIIKPACPAAITGIKQKRLLSILKIHCQSKRVPLFVYKQDFEAINQKSFENFSRFDFVFGQKIIKNIKLNLAGIFQIDNACLAIAACLKLIEATQFKLTDDQTRKALLKTFFPGRMEIVSKKPLIILDGAHNEDKIKALVSSIKKIYPQKKFIIVFGVKKDKDVKKMLSLLKTISHEFLITQFGQATDLGFELHYPAEKLLVFAKKLMPRAKLYLERNSFEALKRAKKLAKLKRLEILLTGSLYLVGEARQFFKLPPTSGISGRRRCPGRQG